MQEQSRENKATPLSPDDIDEVESPLPLQIQQAVKRRGAISAEPITEEDVASYVKKVEKVILNMLCHIKGQSTWSTYVLEIVFQ